MSLFAKARFKRHILGTDRLLRPGGGGRGLLGGVQFLKRVNFEGSVLKMYKV